MKQGVLHIAAAGAAAIISGMLLYAAFPSPAIAPLAWIGLVPLLVVVCRTKPLPAFLLAYISGAVFFLGLFDWIRLVPGYTALHHALLAVYLGAFFAGFGLAVSWIARRLGVIGALAAAPFVWVLAEYLRANLTFLALPWGLLAHSQYRFPSILQAASVAGIYGVSFLAVLVNAGIAGLLMHALAGHLPQPSTSSPAPERRPAFFLAGAAAVLTAAALVFGALAMRDPIEGQPVRLALIQGNIALSEKQDLKNAAAIMATYERLSREAAKSRPDLIVWPENATPRSIAADRNLFEQVRRVARESEAYLLLGSSNLQKFNVKDAKKSKFANSAFLIPPRDRGNPPQRYDKIRLFPFGEVLPHQNIIPWDAIGVPAVDAYLQGTKFTVFDIEGVPFAVTICWENLFPDMVRQFVREGARFIVNITNEVWFGEQAAPEQFLSMGVMRAVENGVYMVRCGNTGISCIIDPCGRVVDRVRNTEGRDTFVSGHLVGEVIPRAPNTIYTRYGDWFPVLCITAAAGFILAALFKPRHRL